MNLDNSDYLTEKLIMSNFNNDFNTAKNIKVSSILEGKSPLSSSIRKREKLATF
jgi:hypothetical protein